MIPGNEMSAWISKYRFKKGRSAAVDRKRQIPWSAVMLGLILWIVSLTILYTGRGVSHTKFVEGQRSPSTVVALVDFEAVDVGATELIRRQAMDAVLPVFSIHKEPHRAAVRKIDTIFDLAKRIRRQDSQYDVPTEELPEIGGLTLNVKDVLELSPEGHEDTVASIIKDALQSAWHEGIISPLERASMFHGVASAGAISLRLADGSLRSPVELQDLSTPDAAVRDTVHKVRSELRELSIPVSDRPIATLLSACIEPNLRYDDSTTESLRSQAGRNVDPVMKTIRAGATLVQAGERIGQSHLEVLRAHERKLGELETVTERRLTLIGQGALLLFAIAICGGLLLIMNPAILYERSKVLLLMILALLSFAPSKGLVYMSGTAYLVSPSLAEFMLPVALAPLLAVILLGISSAVVIGIWTSFAIAVLFDNSFPVFVMGLLVTILVAHTARDIKRRMHVLRTGVWVGLAQMIYAVSLALLHQTPISMAAIQAGTAMGTGLSVALLSLLILPILEGTFKNTTNITLLELSDMTHPLLQRLALEAPGTYHHSLMVANLGQSAAAAIGANALLVRVCAYYHDIGKLTKPEFFVENMQLRENPHDDLTPSMSTLVIISHVKEGVSMANRYNMPQPIIDGIEQHHGTSLVFYFYHRAITQHDGASAETPVNGRPVSEDDYRYPGPKPKTKEMAVLHLADSVEAASRAMDKPSPGRVESMVNEIVDARLHDEQLDESNLTFAELKSIKKSFIFTLSNMLHGRIAYPKDENRGKQSPERIQGSSREYSKVQPVDNGTGPAPQ